MTMFVPECSLLGGPLFSRPVRAMRSAHRPRQAGPATQRSGSGNDSGDTSWFGRGSFWHSSSGSMFASSLEVGLLSKESEAASLAVAADFVAF